VNFTHVEDHSTKIINQNLVMPNKAVSFYHPTESKSHVKPIEAGTPFYMYLIPIILIWFWFYRRSLIKAKLAAKKETEVKKMQDECLIDELSKHD
jgi:hypothetical protein